MDEITRGTVARVNVDMVKHVIQVHAVDKAGRCIAARAIKRDAFLSGVPRAWPSCLAAIEACSGEHQAS